MKKYYQSKKTVNHRPIVIHFNGNSFVTEAVFVMSKNKSFRALFVI